MQFFDVVLELLDVGLTGGRALGWGRRGPLSFAGGLRGCEWSLILRLCALMLSWMWNLNDIRYIDVFDETCKFETRRRASRREGW